VLSAAKCCSQDFNLTSRQRLISSPETFHPVDKESFDSPFPACQERSSARALLRHVPLILSQDHGLRPLKGECREGNQRAEPSKRPSRDVTQGRGAAWGRGVCPGKHRGMDECKYKMAAPGASFSASEELRRSARYNIW